MSETSPVEAVFFAALDRPPADRAAYLDAACAGDPALRARVEELLAAHVRAEGLLPDPSAGGTATYPPAESEGTATRSADGGPSTTASHHAAGGEGVVVAGRYKLLQRIGEGGMGTVWMADQTEPVKRRVAVKLVRAERGQSKTILSRFEAERQAIALMDHPHIARLLDAGTTETGSPFFVMELVKGVPLNEFCDAHRLPIPDRLNLFVQICAAVQHAHQKGVIHRDLKPSNVLVESHDGKPVPKVIDFGLAKATTGLQLTEHTLFTGFGSVMGTPLYMAPEQAAFNAVDVDTRADVYALGVILYELLTGTTPLTREAVKKAQLDEMLRLIREQDAPTPSSRLSSSDSAPAVAAAHTTAGPSVVARAGVGGGPVVRLFAPDGGPAAAFLVFDAAARGGVSVAAGDLDGDGSDELAVGPAAGRPQVRVIDPVTGLARRSALDGDPCGSAGVRLAVRGGRVLAVTVSGGRTVVLGFDGLSAGPVELPAGTEQRGYDVYVG